MPIIPFAGTIGAALGATAGTTAATTLGTLAMLGAGGAVAGTAMSMSSQSAAARATMNASNQQTQAINAQTAAQQSEANRVRMDALKNAEDLKKASTQAEEDARLEDMRRRRSQTKTLLTDPFGDESIANINKKTLLGG